MNIIISENQLTNLIKNIFNKKDDNLATFIEYNRDYWSKIESVSDGVGDPMILYSKYLRTIYPNSKIKGILVHGSPIKMVRIDKRYSITYWATTAEYPLSNRLWSSNLTFAVADIRRPFYSKKKLFNLPPEIEDTLNPLYTPDSYDSVIGVDAGQKTGKTIAIKNDKTNTHILGTSVDFFMFRQFLNQI